MITINIKTESKKYPVLLGKDIFINLPQLMKNYAGSKNVFVVADSNVMRLHGDAINNFMKSADGKTKLIRFDANESNKSFKALELIYTALIKDGFGKDSVIAAVGGGITGDIVGFAASTFARGVEFIQVPTTLLAAVDSSVGGKTGINFGQTKNMIGTFYQPDLVLIDTAFLKTLPEEEIICGLGEIVKYAYLQGGEFYSELDKNIGKILKQHNSAVSSVIQSCVSFKAATVEADEKETGLRKILNLGHTFAHAIEVEQKHSTKHGQAVIIGIVCSLFLSHELGLISSDKLNEYLRLPLLLREKIFIDRCNIEEIYKIMLRDKKGRDGRIKFVLITEPGKLLIDVEAGKELVIKSIEDGISLFV